MRDPGFAIYTLSDGWVGSGLTGMVIGGVLGWANVARGDASLTAWAKERASEWFF